MFIHVSGGHAYYPIKVKIADRQFLKDYEPHFRNYVDEWSSLVLSISVALNVNLADCNVGGDSFSN